MAGSGGAVGQVLGGLLTQYLSWRWCLYVNVLFAAAAGAGAVALMHRDVPGRRPRVDLPGAALVSGGMFAIVYGFSNAATHAWGTPSTWGFIAPGDVAAEQHRRAGARGQREQHVDVQAVPPGQVLGQQPAQHQPDRPAAPGDRAVHRERPAPLVGVGERGSQQRQRGRRQQRGERALHRPRADQHREADRRPADG